MRESLQMKSCDKVNRNRSSCMCAPVCVIAGRIPSAGGLREIQIDYDYSTTSYNMMLHHTVLYPVEANGLT
jgi:hypothetical protein